MKFLLTGVLLFITAANAAAAEPIFYPNAKYKSVSQSVLQADLQRCRSEATSAGQGQKQGDGLRQGARSAAKGAAVGALAGAITGNNVGRSVGAGAAVGGVVGTGKTLRERGDNNPEFQKYVSACLEESGYKVTGWK